MLALHGEPLHKFEKKKNYQLRQLELLKQSMLQLNNPKQNYLNPTHSLWKIKTEKKGQKKKKKNETREKKPISSKLQKMVEHPTFFDHMSEELLV